MSGVGPDKFFWKGDRVSDGEWFGLLSAKEAKSRKESGIKRNATAEIKALHLEGKAGYLVLHHSQIGEQGALM